MESSIDWTSVDMLVSQLTEVLSPQEDAETVQEAVSILNNERDAFHHAEESLCGLAKDLQAEADEQESAVELSRVIEEQREQLEQLKKERDASKQRLENGRRDILTREADIARLEEEYVALASKCEKAKEEANKTKEKIKKIFVLYHEFSKIKWDYSKPTVAGILTRTKFSDVIDFEIDPTGKSEYDIANTLWDLMEGEEDRVLVQ
ncbi:hypothetical protein WA171_004793 [Blastocystis sp. BT1]